MNRSHDRRRLAVVALLACALPWGAFAQPAGVDPRADAVLRAMTRYIAGLDKFSIQTELSLEAVTNDGQKVQFVSPASVTVQRPNKLAGERQGDIVDQKFFYDGKTLTYYDPGSNYYATVAAPGNVDAMLEFARDRLDLVAPGADLLDSRAYDELMRDVTSGIHLGPEVVAGQRCHHLAYRSAEVDWQLWVREGDKPAPCRYVITSKTVIGAPQYSVQILKFDTSPKIDAATFSFVPPAGAKAVDFLLAK